MISHLTKPGIDDSTKSRKAKIEFGLAQVRVRRASQRDRSRVAPRGKRDSHARVRVFNFPLYALQGLWGGNMGSGWVFSGQRAGAYFIWAL